MDIYNATQSIKGFATGVFPGHWLEMSKSRLYDNDYAASWTIHRIVRDLLITFSPVCPFFTDYLSTILYGDSAVDARSYPLQVFHNNTETDGYLQITELLIDFNSSTWKAKKEQGLSLKSEIHGIRIPSELDEFKDALTSMHNLIE